MIGLTVNGVQQVAANLARAAGNVVAERRRALMRAGLLIQRELRARVSAPGSTDPFWGRQSGFGTTMTGRTGKTRQRIVVGPVLEAFSTATVSVGSPDPHMALQERGGTIAGRPYLRIPTAAAQTAAGADINAGRSVRGMPGYFVHAAAGRLWIARAGTGGRRIEFLYLLKRSVQVRARRIFAVTRLHIEPMVARMFGAAMTQVVRTANG